MIDYRKAAAYLPFYVVAMVIVDRVSSSAVMGRPDELPIWLLVVFTAMAITVFALVSRYLSARKRGAVSGSTERAILAILAGVVVSGTANDVLAGVVSLLLPDRSVWVMVPIYILTYLICLAVVQWVLSRGARAEK